MKIAICASMVFAEKMVQIKGQLEELGHTVFISQRKHMLKLLIPHPHLERERVHCLCLPRIRKDI